MGERHRGPRARLPRHLPRRRLRASRGQHPAADRRRPAEGRWTARGSSPPSPPRTRSTSASSRASASTRRRRTTSRHLAPAIAAGLGALLGLETAVVYHALNQAVHLGFATRQSRKGQITSWKASAPAWAGKLAIEAVDRAMRGEGAPNPIYEGEDGVIAWMLAGPDAEYAVPLPAPGERPRAILETYPKAHSAEYQAQALIDLAFDLRRRLPPGALAARPRGRRPHEPPHARGHRLRLERSREVRPRRLARDPGPLRSCTSWRSPSRTAAGTTSTPTGPSARTVPSTDRPLAEDPDRGGPGLDGALPRSRPRAEGVRRARRPDAGRRHAS